jgi:hypothetical protein
MTRNLASALAVATAALAAVVSDKAYADDITIDTTPFVSSRSRADVQNELMTQAQQVRAAAGEWSMQGNQLPRIKSTYTSEQAVAEYKVSRDLVRALNGEDSGSAYFIKGPAQYGMNPGATMGGPAR